MTYSVDDSYQKYSVLSITRTGKNILGAIGRVVLKNKTLKTRVERFLWTSKHGEYVRINNKRKYINKF